MGKMIVEKQKETQWGEKFLDRLSQDLKQAFPETRVCIEVSEKDFFIDMLFYHARLHCYIVVELKATEFKPEHAGQLNFYLSAVDERKQEDDQIF